MEYVLAKCGERELDFSTVDSVEEAVVGVVDSIFEDYDLLGANVSIEDFEEDGILTKMFKKANESDYTISLMKELVTLRKSVKDVVDSLRKQEIEEFEIIHEDDPLWRISLTQENGDIKLEAYSNVNNDYMWDVLLKSI
jgi:hypothetical protein